MIPKLDTNIITKLNFSSLRSTDAKFLNQTLANQIEKSTKIIMHHDQIGLIQGCKTGSALDKSNNIILYNNRFKDRNHVILTIDAE